jgi:rRNA maturation RNase YbeY
MNSNDIQFHFQKTTGSFRNRRRLKLFLAEQVKKQGLKFKELHYVFCDDGYLLKINQDFLGHDDYTDIITFNLGKKGALIEGEIYISLDRVRENAQSLGFSFQTELTRVIFHGFLHLCGHKDKTPAQNAEMRRMEDDLLSKYARFVPRETKARHK